VTRPHEFHADDFPLLREFARGYLHQDMVPEHGSAETAARAYVVDLSPAERKQVAAEAARLREVIAHWSEGQINVALAELGAAVRFKSRDEAAHVLEALI